MFLSADVASAATSPQGIYDDYTANGTLKGVYTIEELQAYLDDATVMQLANPTVLADLNNLVTKIVGLVKQGKTFPEALNGAPQGRAVFPGPAPSWQCSFCAVRAWELRDPPAQTGRPAASQPQPG